MSLAQVSPISHFDHQLRLAKTPVANRTVEGDLVFLDANSPEPVSIYRRGVDGFERTGTYQNVRLPIRDMRAIDPTLDVEGFALREVPTAVTDFLDDDQIRDVYNDEIERLIKAETGATNVVIFDYTVRIETENDEEAAHRTPVKMVHNDYTESSGPQRVRDLLPSDDAEAWLAGRFAQINVWRPLRGPVRSKPLALADAQSVLPSDLVAVDLVYPDRVGEIYHTTYSPGQRWFYAPDMTADEVLLIKGYDSARDGRARFSPHTAFDLADRNAPPRESIEVRALASFAT